MDTFKTQNGNSVMSEKSGSRGSDPVEMCRPELPTTLRQIRDHRRLSRAAAYKRHDIAPGYLYELEKGKCQPSPTKLASLIRGYKLNEDQARYLHELNSPSVDLAPEEELGRRMASQAEFAAHLQDMQARDMPGAYLTPIFNILMCNDLLRSVLPEIDEAGSLLVWLFTPVAKEVHADWEREAARAVAMAKGVFARHRDTEQVARLLRRLRRNNDFRRLWTSSIDVSYGRSPNDYKYFRVPGSGDIVAYSVLLSAVPETSDLMLLNVVQKHGVRVPDFLAKQRNAARSVGN
ncbi:helix-turn-helix domain-containing protein [Nocardia brasiliensis]|uniref:MmyB family transcriptional regulator n=1 Tax=Nocardia brasiliensis TaxID=37326 RepID=UPI0037900A39